MKVGIPYTSCKHKSEVPVTREDEAMAFAVGVTLGGGKCDVFMQNSGLGHCVDIITSLLKPYEIDIPIELNIRHTPEHHKYMGAITCQLMELLGYECKNKKTNVYHPK